MPEAAVDSRVNKIISNARVLVVDDAGSIREIEVGLLRDLGFANIHAVIDGNIAWNFLQTNTVDFIICDWDMPNLSGIELLCRMKKDPAFSKIPFLMITASAESKRVQQAIEEGVNDYIVKPFKPQDFAYRVVKLLRKIQVDD